MPREDGEKLVSERLKKAVVDAGYKIDGEAEDAAGLKRKTIISKWSTTTENKATTPMGDLLTKACLAFHETPWHLFGWEREKAADVRAIALKEIGRLWGRSVVEMVQRVEQLSPESRRRLLGYVDGWIARETLSSSESVVDDIATRGSSAKNLDDGRAVVVDPDEQKALASEAERDSDEKKGEGTPAVPGGPSKKPPKRPSPNRRR